MKLQKFPAEILQTSDQQLLSELRIQKQFWFADLDEIVPHHQQKSVDPDNRTLAEKQSWITETFTVTSYWFTTVVQFSDLEPTVDAFASNGNQRVSKFCTIQDDAFKQN